MIRLCLCLFGAAVLLAAQSPAQFPFTQDVAPSKTFDAKGDWTLTGIVGSADITHLTEKQKRKLIGTALLFTGNRAVFWNKKVMSRQKFPTPVIGQETYDTQSREFWLDLRTDPKPLNLPRYVDVIDIELGDILVVDPNRVLFDYQGTWYQIARAAR